MSEGFWFALVWSFVSGVLAVYALYKAQQARDHASRAHGTAGALNRVVFATRQRLQPSGKVHVHGEACPVCGENGGQQALWEGGVLQVTCWACGDWSRYVPESRK
jgi:membrane protein implicated in regulation of membrane protease activity